MTIRRDEVNLIVTVNDNRAGNSIRDLQKMSRDLRRQLENIPIGTKDFDVAQAKLKAVNDQLAKMQARVKGVAAETKAASGGTEGGLLGKLIGGGAAVFGTITAVFIALRSLFNFGAGALRELDEGLKADAQIKAALKSTGEVAGRSFEDLKRQASELQKVTLFGDDQIEKGQALFLTFKNIRGEILDKAVPAALDLSTAFGQDVSASAVQLGKALDNPIKGVTALQRVGVSFSDSQKKMIQSLVDTGQTAEAQRIILAELESQVGGSARAAAEAGLGPYQLLQNRLGEVRESFGALIERGLKAFAPALTGVVGFVEEFTDSLVSGEKANGKYAGAVEFVKGALKLIVKPLQVVWELLKIQMEIYRQVGEFIVQNIVPALVSFGTWIGNLIERAQHLPIIGIIFRNIAETFSFFKQLFEDVPATFAGIQAAAGQMAANLKAGFEVILLSAQILRKGLQAALSLNAGDRAQAVAELAQLKTQLAAAAQTAGTSIGKAYADARAKAIRETAAAAEAQRRADEAAENKKAAQQAILNQEAANERLQKTLKAALDKRLKEIEVSFLKEELALDFALFKKEISESEHDKRVLEEKKKAYEARILAFQKFNQDETREALEAKKALLAIERQLTPVTTVPLAALPGRPIGPVTSQGPGIGATIGQQTQEGIDAQKLREKFAQIMGIEQEGELQRLDIQRKLLGARLAFLENAGEQDKDLYKDTLEEKAKLDEEYATKSLGNDRKSAEQKKAITQEGLNTAKSAVDFAIELLSRDEKARKKNAAAIKTLQTGQVLIDGILEVQKIWSHSADLGPIAGPILAAIQTGFAVARTALAISKIQAHKFAVGGMLGAARMGYFGGRSHSAGGTKGIFEDGTAIEVERDEAFAIVNKRNAPMLRLLSAVNAAGGRGVPFFAGGGLPNINTTPGTSTSALATQQAAFLQMEQFSAAVVDFRNTVAAFPREVKSRVNYIDIEKAGSEVDTVRSLAEL